ncbi:MAG: hypothetical protein QOH81_2235 [Sphingomonadales bacterium]|nr:hypothetical protein [Sphingomonadales bacterium]
MPRLRLRVWAVRALLVPLCLLAAASAVEGCRNALMVRGSIDFGMSLKAAQDLARENPYRRHALAPEGFAQRPRADANPFPMEPMQVPSALILLWPYALLSWPTAKLAWLISNLMFTAGLLVLGFRRLLPGRDMACYVALTAALLASFPWRVVVGNGQHLAAGLFFWLLAAALADRGHPLAAGAALAASFVKYSVTLFLLPWFLLKRQWGPLLTALAVHALITLGIAWRLGENPVSLVLQALRTGAATLLYSGYVDMFAITHGLGVTPVVAAAAALALAGLAVALALSRPPPNQGLFLAALAFLSLLVLYHRAYDALILFLPLLVLVERAKREPMLAALVAAPILLCWYVDRAVLQFTPWLDRAGGFSAYYWLVASLFYLALALLLVRSCASRRGRDWTASAPHA